MKNNSRIYHRIFSLKWTLLFTFFVAISFLVIDETSVASSKFNSSPQNTTLTIYAYESLLDWGLDPNNTKSQVFDAFETQEGCSIELEIFPDAGSVLATAISEKNSPKADIIIGIDNVMIHEAKKQDILVPYEPITSAKLLSSAINGLDSDFYVTPYDYGLISLIYHKNYVNSSTLPTIDNLQLSDLTNPDFAKMLITEDPTLSSTGLGYLMWTIGVYEKLLNQDWKIWWNATRSHIQIEQSWGDAFTVFYEQATERPIMVSYGTDPAYNYLFYDDTSLGATVSHENESTYGWLQIEGLGILKKTDNLELAQKFIDWFTSETVQELIPENNWMYPANTIVNLPDSYDYAIDPTIVLPLNDLFKPEEIASNLDEWLNTWEEVIILGYTTETTPFPWEFLILGLFTVIIFSQKRKKTN